MDWTAPIDSYCERLDPAFWAEPVNAVTNAAFLIAALVTALRLRGRALPVAWALTGILATTGIGSFLFHTFARPWAGMADTLPILLFILAYLYAATRDFLGATWKTSALVTLGYFPFATVTIPLFRLIPGLAGSAGYATVSTLMVVYAGLLWRRSRDRARAGTRRRDAHHLDHRARVGRTALRRLPSRHPFLVAPRERRHAWLDDRGLPAAHGTGRPTPL